MNNSWQFGKFIKVMMLVSCLTMSHTALAQIDVELPSHQAISGAVARVEAAVVQIETIGGKGDVGGQRVTNQPRTGLVVDSQGFIVTASFNLAHEPTTIFVRTANGDRLPAEIVSRNHSRKITLLKIEPKQPLAQPPMVDRSTLAVGQTAIAIGRSMDWQQPNVSAGIISAVRRIWDKAIQTDAGISPHNFGGPLIDLDGNVMGILVPMSPKGKGPADGTEWYDSGIGFAVPIEPWELEQMLAGNDLHSGLLGVTFTEDHGYASRPVIAACPGNSPAARAGLKPGDEITHIDGVLTPLVTQVRHALGPRYAGQPLSIQFLRDETSQQVEVELVQKIEPWLHGMLGIIAQPTADELRVVQLIAGGPAETTGVQIDDRLVSLNGKPVNDRSEIEYELMTVSVGDSVKLLVNRDGEQKELSLPLFPLSADLMEQREQVAAGDSKIVQLKVAESPNVCHGYFPESADPSALLLWIGKPGEIDPEAVLKRWKTWCHETNTALLIPQSLDEKKWSRDEVEFLNKVAGQARDQFQIDPWRVAVGGQATGGVMASLVAMSERTTWRGLVLVDALPSMRVTQYQSEPGIRQLILLLDDQAEEKVADEIQRWSEHFQDQAFPVHRQDVGEDSFQQLITRWLTTLDRF